ncbi:MAG: hypothetical protein ACPG4T_15745 [Nannocystaceae bacterium]
MTLTSSEMKQLEQQSASLGSKHKSYLAEASNAIKLADNPRAGLHLLAALRSTARPNQKDAISDVRRWIDNRLRDEPGISTARLLLELGWLRRLCVVRDPGTLRR